MEDKKTRDGVAVISDTAPSPSCESTKVKRPAQATLERGTLPFRNGSSECEGLEWGTRDPRNGALQCQSGSCFHVKLETGNSKLLS